MKITTNMAGNYNPYKITNQKASVHKTAQIQKSAQIQKPENILELSKSEKDFFKNIYPENVKEIMNYHFYQQNGEMSGVAIGSLIDRRG